MDGSPSIPLPRPALTHPPPLPPQVYLRCPSPSPPPPPRQPGAVAPAPAHVHYFCAPSPIPMYSPRVPGPRYIAVARQPPPAAAAASVAPPTPPAPAASPAQLLPPRPPNPSPHEAAMAPPHPLARRGRPKSKAPDKEQKNERNNAQFEVGQGETEQGHHKESTTGPINGIKRLKKTKGPSHSHGATEVHDNITKIQKELSDLQAELDKVVYLLKVADPMGEAAHKRDLKPREANPQASIDDPRPESKKQEKIAQDRTTTEENSKGSCSTKTEVDKPAEVED